MTACGVFPKQYCSECCYIQQQDSQDILLSQRKVLVECLTIICGKLHYLTRFKPYCGPERIAKKNLDSNKSYTVQQYIHLSNTWKILRF